MRREDNENASEFFLGGLEKLIIILPMFSYRE
jgi:hypothetical protein